MEILWLVARIVFLVISFGISLVVMNYIALGMPKNPLSDGVILPRSKAPPEALEHRFEYDPTHDEWDLSLMWALGSVLVALAVSTVLGRILF